MRFCKAATLVTLLCICMNAQAERFSVMVPGIPRPVTLSFPDGFRPPSSTEERDCRERFLDFYRLNPAIKGKYTEVLLRDWKSDDRLPQIVIGALGSTEKQQGRISQSNWQEIREMFLKSGAPEIKNIRESLRPKVEAGSPVTNVTTNELLWIEEQEDPNSVTLLAQMQSQLDGKKVDVISARKLLFYKGYLLFANIVVDSSKPDALRDLKTYLAAIAVEDI